jgi:hypothetical protein
LPTEFFWDSYRAFFFSFLAMHLSGIWTRWLIDNPLPPPAKTEKDRLLLKKIEQSENMAGKRIDVYWSTAKAYYRALVVGYMLSVFGA